MNKLVIYLFTCFLIGTSVTREAGAQSIRNLGALTLTECITIAQDQSAIANAARYALIASKWRYRSFRADLLPSLELSGNAPNYTRALRQEFTGDGVFRFFPVIQSDASVGLSVNQNILYTGGTLSLSTGLTRLGIFQNEDTYLWQSTPMVLSYRQPLFQFNNLKWRNRLEPLQYEISQKQFVEDMEDIAVTVTENFFDVYLAQINLENAEFNVARNDSIYQLSIGRYNIGTIAENEFLQAELELRNAEAELVRTRIEYERSLNEFKILLGYTTDVTLNMIPPENLPDISVNVEKAKRLAMQNNSEALTYRLNEELAERDLAQAKSEASFQATIDVNFGLNQTSENFSNIYNNPLNRQFFTLGFDIPIFNWGKARAEINAARNQQQEVANSIEYQRRQFIQEVEYTVNQFLQLKGQVKLAAQADTIARRRYEVAQNRYSIGNIDITDLFDAQNARDAARQQYVGALADFWLGWYELRQLTLYNFRTNEPITYVLD